MSYRRWLQFLTDKEPEALALPAEQRVTPERIRAYVADMEASLRKTSVAIEVDGLAVAVRLIAPTEEWVWLKAIKSRLAAQATPLNRLPRLQPPWSLYRLGISLMDGADAPNDVDALKQFRDGLIIALLSLWPIRRRSLAALTVDRHIRRQGGPVVLHLYPEDTKGKRAESFAVPSDLIVYFDRYLNTVRPCLLEQKNCAALWVSSRGTPLSGDAIYKSFRAHTDKTFGQPMGLHDVRRAAATFLAIEAPEKVGLIPQILSHTNREISDQHYNLAGSAAASRRFLDAIGLETMPSVGKKVGMV